MNQVYDCALGRVTCLVDGAKVFGAEVFPSVEPDYRLALLGAAGETEIRTEFNAFLLELPGQPLTLVDVGCGQLFGPDAGKLAGLLAAQGIAASDVERVIFTHLHGDHVGGTLDGDTLVFPNAEMLVHKDELTRWWGTGRPGDLFQSVYAGRIQPVGDAQELSPGIVTWHLPGHTPGHMGLRLADALVIVGDIMHAEVLQLPDPQIASMYDDDPEVGRASRLAALAEIADRGLVYAGGHQLGPAKFGRLKRQGKSFVKVAA